MTISQRDRCPDCMGGQRPQPDMLGMLGRLDLSQPGTWIALTIGFVVVLLVLQIISRMLKIGVSLLKLALIAAPVSGLGAFIWNTIRKHKTGS